MRHDHHTRRDRQATGRGSGGARALIDEVAQRLGMSRRAYLAWEQGKRHFSVVGQFQLRPIPL
jgi:transcriptional regulator with XRE-family HTH domain